MITLHKKRSDWFTIDPKKAEPLWGVPGPYLEGSNLVIHRSHLPLINTVIQPYVSDSNEWAKRDEWYAQFGVKPRVVQHQALDFAKTRRGVFLGDEMRLGKTLSALMMHRQWGAADPLVIVAPLSTRAVWLGWARRIFPGVDIGIITGKTFKPEILKKPIIFGHYDVIHEWQSLFDIETLIADEIQLLVNPGPARSKAAALLASRARNVVCLSGTPINKFPPDMWVMLNMVSPGAWGSYHEFARRYGDPEPTAYGNVYRGSSNESELAKRLSDVMLRRLWKDCHSDLPAITRSVVTADLNQTERNKLDIIAGQLKANRLNTAAALASYRKAVTRVKLPAVLREAIKVVERGEPVVVWTWHKEFAELIGKELDERGHVVDVIHGEISIGERDRRMDAWRSKPNSILVANMAVAGAGIDLSHARIAIFGELDYTPSTIGQTEMRTFAPTRPMDVIFVVANHLIDQKIVGSLVAKLGASDPLGVAAAIDSINALRDAVLGTEEQGDLDRLMDDILASF